MRDVLCLERLDQAEALLRPQRIDVLRQLSEPRTCSEIAAELGQTPQRVYYHVKKLEDAGLVEMTDERRVRGINEGIYRATAQSYWLSPKLVGTIGRRAVEDHLSLGYLLSLVEDVQLDLARIDRGTGDRPTLGISGEVRLQPEQRQGFLDDLRAVLEDLFTRYGGSDGEAFRLAVACYPKGEHHE
ncbi:MAG: helix-turn-helix domain-containing protein [Acidimicrobiales bacterium]